MVLEGWGELAVGMLLTYGIGEAYEEGHAKQAKVCKSPLARTFLHRQLVLQLCACVMSRPSSYLDFGDMLLHQHLSLLLAGTILQQTRPQQAEIGPWLVD